MATLDFTETGWCPDLPSDVELAWNVDKIQFGDGYQQRTLRGINNLKRTFRVSYTKRQSELLEIDSYLSRMGAKMIPYYDRGLARLVMVYCDDWAINWFNKVGAEPVGVLRVTFVQAYGAGAPNSP